MLILKRKVENVKHNDALFVVNEDSNAYRYTVFEILNKDTKDGQTVFKGRDLFNSPETVSEMTFFNNQDVMIVKSVKIFAAMMLTVGTLLGIAAVYLYNYLRIAYFL